MMADRVWTSDPTKGEYTSDYFRIIRQTQGYELWLTAPKSFHLLSKTSTLAGAKADALEWARQHQV
jgi:hypothetical protein